MHGQSEANDKTAAGSPVDAVGRIAEHLRKVRARRSLVARWTDLADRLKELDVDAVAAFEHATADLVPAMERVDAVPDDEGVSDLRAMARRLERTAETLAAPLDQRRLDERLLVVRHARVDLASFLHACLAPFQPVARTRGVMLELTGPARLLIETDPSKVERAFATLLFCAISHARPGARLLAGFSTHGKFVEIRVSDDGSHLDGSSLPAEAAVAGPADLASALALARDLTVLCGGSLILDVAGADSISIRLRIPVHAPRGTVVHDTFDPPRMASELATLLERQGSAEWGVGAASNPRSRPRVVVAEDDPLLHRLIVDGLPKHYEVISAFDGVEALSQMTRHPSDLVILDLTMPELDGQAVVREMRARRELSNVPVLVVTGLSEADQLVSLLENGVQDVVHKPFVVAEIAARARNLVEAKRARDLLEETIGKRETDLVALAEEVARQQRALRETLGALDGARRTAEDAGRIKSNFLRMMSHELRTPITAMELQLRLLERKAGLQMTSEVKEGFDRIARSSRRLCHLVDTVLAWARVESGRCKLDIARVDLAALAREAVGEVVSHATQKGVSIELVSTNGDVRVPTDRKLVRLLLVNLVDRAVGVSESGTVIVEVQSRDRGGWIAVRDRGAPIGPEETEASYSPLSVAGDFHRRSGAGSGLDLHVVRDIARAIEGDLAIEPSSVGNILTLFVDALSEDFETGERPAVRLSDVRSRE